MKKITLILIFVICICGLVGCNNKSKNTVKIDYGNSEIYTKQDMDEAIKLIENKFNTWKGCELHSISYTSDEKCNTPDNIAWMESLAKANDIPGDFTQCIMFESDYHSPKNAEDAGGWNPDYEYTDWEWWLARSENGEWKLLTWGY